MAYVEQRFGAWTVPGGIAALGTVLAGRLGDPRRHRAHRHHRPRPGAAWGPARGRLHLRGRAGRRPGRVRGRPAPPARARAARARTVPAIPPVVCHLGLSDAHALPDLPHEVVLHGDPMLVVRTGGRAPDGGGRVDRARPRPARRGPARALARHRIDVRDRVVVRIDRVAARPRRGVGRLALGVLWQGRATTRRRLGPTTPVTGVYAAGAHATPGSGLPFVGLSAALVARAIGPA